MQCELLEDRSMLAAFQVQSILDTGGLTATGGSGTDNDPYLIDTLRSAIQQANLNPGADTITFNTAGTFATSQTITLGGSELPITDAVTITGTGASNLTIDANQQSRIFNINDGNDGIQLAVELVGMKLTGGNVPGNSFSARGGAILSSENLTVRDTLVTGNSAGVFGGGILSRNFGATTITGSTISGNSAGAGGGVFSFNYAGTTTISSSTISGNSSINAGGGIVSYNSGTTTIDDSLISDNFSPLGGALYLSNTGTARITNSVISGNSASDGGGIHALSSGLLTIADSELFENSANFVGGAIKVIGNARITGTTLSENSASRGGAIWTKGTIAISNSTVSGKLDATARRRHLFG
jgi:predicted outer membrane repeat protein